MSSDLMLMLWDSFVETFVMVGLSGLIGSIFGIPLGILLHVTDNGGVHPMPIFNKVLGWIINAVRSTPFIILLDRHGRRGGAPYDRRGALYRAPGGNEPA